MADTHASVYLPYRVKRTHAQMRLFCFPYAGGNAAVFQKWHRLFPEWIEVCPLQYPGRGNRMREPPFTNAIPLAHDLARALPSLLDLPFAFFGHSMGGIIAFEVVRELRRKQLPQPLHLFVSSIRAPQFPNRDGLAYDMPEPQFKVELRRLNGTPNEVLENDELMGLMLPMLRADFSVAQTYAYVEEERLSFPLTVYGGLEDPSVSLTELEGWREHTRGEFKLQMFSGDHFYLHASELLLTADVLRELRASAPVFSASSGLK